MSGEEARKRFEKRVEAAQTISTFMLTIPKDEYEELLSAFERTVSSNVIDRRAALDAISEAYMAYDGDEFDIDDCYEMAADRIRALPGVDAISRQDVLDALTTSRDTESREDTTGIDWIDYEYTRHLIKELKPARPANERPQEGEENNGYRE